MAIDHGPAWALIPWYGADGLGAPTLDDWRVWADWLMRYDPDDERDARIVQLLGKLTGDPLGAAFTLLHVAPWQVGNSRMLVKMRVRDGRLVGFEVQPTRREMRHPPSFDTLVQAVGRATTTERGCADVAHAMRWLLCHGGYNDRITSAERRYIAALMHGKGRGDEC